MYVLQRHKSDNRLGYQHITLYDQSEDNQTPCAVAMSKKIQIKEEERY